MAGGRLREATLDFEFLKFILIDGLVATVVGLVAWIVSQDSAISLVLSLLTAVLLFVLELRTELTVTKQKLAASMELSRTVLDDASLRRGLQQIAGGYGAVKTSGDPIFMDRAEELVQRAGRDFSLLGEGRAEYAQEEVVAVAISLVREARESFTTTVFPTIAKTVFEAEGRAYIQENFDAVKRGVRVTRTFLLADMNDLASVRETMTFLAEGGIDVRVVFTEKIPRDLVLDFCVVDDRYAFTLDTTPGRDLMRNISVSRDAMDIRKAKAAMQRVLRHSEPFEEVLARVGPLKAADVALKSQARAPVALDPPPPAKDLLR